MDERKLEEFRKKLHTLVFEYNIKDASFTGTMEDSYIGIFVPIGGKAPLDGLLLSVCNVGRLWQHARTLVREQLDVFEKGGSNKLT